MEVVWWSSEFKVFVDWMGGQSGPTMDSGDFVDESDYAPSSRPKTIQVLFNLGSIVSLVEELKDRLNLCFLFCRAEVPRRWLAVEGQTPTRSSL